MRKTKKQFKFRPTPAYGVMSEAKKREIQKTAPEVLVAPKAREFGSEAAYTEALRKFKKYGNWSSSY
jgi:hypothetical protein